METRVHLPDSEPPATIREVVAALKKQKLVAKHDKQTWGDWVSRWFVLAFVVRTKWRDELVLAIYNLRHHNDFSGGRRKGLHLQRIQNSVVT